MRPIITQDTRPQDKDHEPMPSRDPQSCDTIVSTRAHTPQNAIQTCAIFFVFCAKVITQDYIIYNKDK